MENPWLDQEHTIFEYYIMGVANQYTNKSQRGVASRDQGTAQKSGDLFKVPFFARGCPENPRGKSQNPRSTQYGKLTIP